MASKNSSTKSLAGKVALVTGASRGIGRGIALQLSEAGATVYISGRAPDASYAKEANGMLPSLEQTAKDANERGGGKCHPIYCDHSNLEDIKKLFKRIEDEQGGRLDILVNNAYSGAPALLTNAGKKFWDSDPELWDAVNNVGLRNVYFCSTLAARLMVPRGDGLIVNISSVGGQQYMVGVAYGVGKAAVDRMAADMAMELKGNGITAISLWPGFVQTELLSSKRDEASRLIGQGKEDFNKLLDAGESPEFSGKAIVALANDQNRIEKTGKIHTTTELAIAYKFRDINGLLPPDARSTQ